MQTVQFALADFDKSRLLCKDARYDAFHRLASTTRRVILCEKIVKSVAGDRVQTVQFALADFDKSRLLCKDARYDATQRVLRSLAVSFRRYRQK